MAHSPDHVAIEKATAALLEAVNAADAERVVSIWSENGVLMPPHHAAVHGRAAIEAYFRELFARVRFKFVFTESVILVDGDTAIERLSYDAEAWSPGSAIAKTDSGKGLHVYRRSAGRWSLAIDVWNSDLPRGEA